MGFRHNKKRNCALVYEFLIRRMTSQTLDGNSEGLKKTFEIVKKYFHAGSLLAEEREFFETVKNTRGVSENVARQVLAQIKLHSRKMELRGLEIKKNNLIKEINYTYGKKFFSEHRIPEYRMFASVQIVIDGCRGVNQLSENVQRIQLEESLVQFMMTKESAAQVFQAEQKVDSLVLSLAEQRFQEKYGKSLNESQKNTLRRYIDATASSSSGAFEKFLSEEKANILKILDKSVDLKEVKDDPIMKLRLGEAISKLNGSLGSSREQIVEEMMLYQKLCEELSSNE